MNDEQPIDLYTVDTIPGENFLVKCLQKQIRFIINEKPIKQGKLLLFKRTHYYVQISLQTVKSNRENFEIPFPFRTENYDQEGLMYYDYRVSSLGLSKPLFLEKKKPSSIYFNKILEIQVVN
jgi:hypothetical protein